MDKGRFILVESCISVALLWAFRITSSEATLPSQLSVTWNFTDLCIGGDNALTSTDVRLTYSFNRTNAINRTIAEGPIISKNNVSGMAYNLSYPGSRGGIGQVEYFFEQLEHGGGLCNCLEIVFDTFPDSPIYLCDGSASSPRRVNAVWSAQSPEILTMDVTQVNKIVPFMENCTSEPYIKIAFQIIFRRSRCFDRIDAFDEGVEFAVRLSSLPDEWIPLKFFHFDSPLPGSQVYVQLRGYTVQSEIISEEEDETITLNVCNTSTEENYLQFRWLQTSSLLTNNARDIWFLDNIRISIINDTHGERTLLKENFDGNYLDPAVWPEDNIRNGELGSYCELNQTLVFGNVSNVNSELGIDNIPSRSLLTKKLNLIQNEEVQEYSNTVFINPTEVFTSSSVLSNQSRSFPKYNEQNCRYCRYFEIFPQFGSVISTHWATPHAIARYSCWEYFQIAQNAIQDSYNYFFAEIVTTEATVAIAISMNISQFKYCIIFSTFPASFEMLASSLGLLTSQSSSIPDKLVSSVVLSDQSRFFQVSFQILSSFGALSSLSSLQASQARIISSSVQIAVSSIGLLNVNESISMFELEVLNEILQNEELSKIILSERNITERIFELENITSRESSSILVSSYLFTVVTQSLANETYSPILLKNIIEIGNNILQSQQLISSLAAFAAPASVLFAFDFLLFTYFPDNLTFVSPNIILQSQVIQLEDNTPPFITAINTTSIDLGSNGPEISLTLPLELLKIFTKDGETTIRIISAIYRNISAIFLSDLSNNSSLGSDIVGTSIQCGMGRCPTSNVTLSASNVIITFEHSRLVQETIERTQVEAMCVFLDVQDTSDVLKVGRWSTRGCTRNARLSSSSRTVCDCNHLTHFAILLSPRPPTFSAPILLSFSVIAYVGITISVIAMAVTIIIFCTLMFNKKNSPLLNMRNYVHINLCLSLSIAQIIYISGVDRTGPSGENVPIHCQVVAVFLHYFFLVSFMWMLMEGVLLYLALVRVFVSRTKSYLFLFTTLSYGIPLLYLCVTVPLGIIYGGYGDERACFLNSTNQFIWTFIAPIVLIMILNICFFIMAAIISWKQHKKRVNDKNLEVFRGWLRSLIPLVIVLGLTWITGLLVLELEVLVPLAYIYTITVAFQGLFIFVVLVLFSKAVRTDYIKWWTTRICKSKNSSNHTVSTNLKSIELDVKNKAKKGDKNKNDISFVAANPLTMN